MSSRARLLRAFTSAAAAVLATRRLLAWLDSWETDRWEA